jgi:predicted SAM-dependent methyltransferase
MQDYHYIQYGCGWSAPSGWRNFDVSPTLLFERLPLIGRLYTRNASRFPANVEYGDITKGLPIPSESCHGVYCSHILEHLSLDDFRTALRNTKRMLRAGGIFRLVVPDLEYLIRQYLNNSSYNAAPEFIKETCLGQETRVRGFKDFFVTWLGNSRHLWMWDYKSIEWELQNAGFIDIRKALFGDSADPNYQEVEDEERWNNSLGVECRRPR